MAESTLSTISSEAQQRSIPLIYMHSLGFYATVSIQLPPLFPIVETHPDPESTQDLRLTNPWPELAAAAQKIENLDSLDDHQHGHVPYLLLLLHYLEKWKQSHDGQPPKNYSEKREFQNLLRSGARTGNPEGGEENFDEAVAAVLKSLNPWTLRSNVRELFAMDECTNPTAESDTFWIIALAHKLFYDAHGVLPLPGSLPDMKAQSADYIWLQNMYKAKAREDLAEVEQTVRAIEEKLHLPPGRVPSREIEVFCKNASHIKVIRGTRLPLLQQSRENIDSSSLSAIQNALDDPDSLIPIFIAIKVLDKLVTEYRTSNSQPHSSLLDDPDNWTRVLSSMLPDTILSSEENGDHINEAMEETRRAGAGELHNISSFAGGTVAQEALKLLTRQYVPLDNTFVFDGVKSRGGMFRL
jgi:amyloid beta precursor protein binding protein 1